MFIKPTRSGILLLIAIGSTAAVEASDPLQIPLERSLTHKPQAAAMKVSIEIAGTAISATLDDSQTARDFAALLPLSLTLEDFAETEKISQLPRRLSTEGAPGGITPKAGDLAYYEPWGNLAIFHKDFRHSPKLVRLGTLDSGLELIRQRGAVKVTIRQFGQ